jgi:hypothetical protein
METPLQQEHPGAWRGAPRHGSRCNLDARQQELQAHVHDQLVVQRLGRLDLTMITGGPQELVRTQQQITGDDPRALLLVLQIEGSSKIEQEDRAAELMPGDMTLIDWARPLRVRFDDGCRVLVLSLAHAPVTALVGWRSLPPATRLEGQSGIGALLGSYLRALGDQAEQLDLISAVAAEHVVAMLSLAFGQEPVPPDEPPPCLARLQLVPSYTEDDLADPTLSPERVAEADRRHGVPPRACRRSSRPGEHLLALTTDRARMAA